MAEDEDRNICTCNTCNSVRMSLNLPSNSNADREMIRRFSWNLYKLVMGATGGSLELKADMK